MSNDSNIFSSLLARILPANDVSQDSLNARKKFERPSGSLATSSSGSESSEIYEAQLRQLRWNRLLSEPVINEEKLRDLAWRGVPEESRSLVWQLLLHYQPLVKDRRDSTLTEKRQKYWNAVGSVMPDRNAKLTGEYERSVYHQIVIDVPRTNPSVPLFQIPQIQERLVRILYVWAIRHPASGYVQGINDLITPFFCVFLQPYLDGIDVLLLSSEPELETAVLDNVEADTYWCVSKFIDHIQDNYTFAQPGIQRMVYRLQEIIKRIDMELYTLVTTQRIDFIQFSFRWMNCLLMREFPIKLVFRTWDTYLAEGANFSSLHVYVCAVFLLTWKDLLVGREFHELMTVLQHLPTQDWTDANIEPILSQAFVLMQQYQDSGHLQ